jgi:hypothetical protein
MKTGGRETERGKDTRIKKKNWWGKGGRYCNKDNIWLGEGRVKDTGIKKTFGRETEENIL